MARDFAAELIAAREAGDWDAHARIWEERRVGSVEADEAALADEYQPGDKVVYRGEVAEIDSRYENSGDYLVLCADGMYRQANPLELSASAPRPPVDWTGVREIHDRRDAAAAKQAPASGLTLEEYLDKVAADNDLTTVAVGRMLVGERIVRTATVHYTGHAADGIACDSGTSDTSVREALHKAIEKAQANRAPLAVMPCAIPSLELAA